MMCPWRRPGLLVCLSALVLLVQVLGGGCTPPLDAGVSSTREPAAVAQPAASASSPAAPGTPPDPRSTPCSGAHAWASQELALLSYSRADLALLDDPTFYRLDLTIDVDRARLWGRAELCYTNNEDVSLPGIYFRLFPNMDIRNGGSMEIEQVTVAGHPVSPAYELEDTAIYVPFASPLTPKESVQLELSYRVSVPRVAGGNYGAFAMQQGVMALAHAYPFVPVYDDEGWNIELAPTIGDIIYADISLYELSVTAPEGVVVVATGAPLPIVAHDDGTATWRFVSGPARDINIVLSRHFQLIQRPVEGIVVNMYFLPQDRQGAEQLLDIAVAAVRIFNRRFGPYPYSELDVVPTFTSAAGIEYPSLIVIAQALYADAERAEWVVAHEVAHQWWYNVVGNDQVDEPWLDEALTQYSTVLYYEERYGRRAGDLARESGLQGRWDRVLNDGRDRPVAGSVASFAPEEYGPIVYGKGGLFFHALRQLVGDRTFDDILRAYYQEHRYGIATAESLLAVAEAVSGRDLQWLYHKWILE